MPSDGFATVSAMETTRAQLLDDEIATLAAHLNAGTARLVELIRAISEDGGLADETARYVAFRCGVSSREARELVRVAESLCELPAIRTAFSRGELTLTKVRALTRVATPASEHGLLELASALSAAQLERALRAFRRIQSADVADAQALEYVDYHWADDGSLYLRARLSADDGTVVVKALEAARERVQAQQVATSAEELFEPPRSPQVQAFVELAHSAHRAASETEAAGVRLVVHVDAGALTADGSGRSELEDGPVIPPETARRLGCDAQTVSTIERDGLPLGVGRTRRTVPPALRRLLEARDDGTCRWPGCENRRHLAAHHRTHWAHGGETSFANLILLCTHHHRLVHEGGYTIEDDREGGIRFRNRYGVLCPGVSRPPPGEAAELVAGNKRRGLSVDPLTNRNGGGDPLDLDLAVSALHDLLDAA